MWKLSRTKETFLSFPLCCETPTVTLLLPVHNPFHSPLSAQIFFVCFSLYQYIQKKKTKQLSHSFQCYIFAPRSHRNWLAWISLTSKFLERIISNFNFYAQSYQSNEVAELWHFSKHLSVMDAFSGIYWRRSPQKSFHKKDRNTVYQLHRTGKSRISNKVVFSSHITSNLNINLTKNYN